LVVLQAYLLNFTYKNSEKNYKLNNFNKYACKLLNKCTNYCSIHIYWMLTKFYNIYKDIKYLVWKN
jgi:hypothetical protein